MLKADTTHLPVTAKGSAYILAYTVLNALNLIATKLCFMEGLTVVQVQCLGTILTTVGFLPFVRNIPEPPTFTPALLMVILFMVLSEYVFALIALSLITPGLAGSVLHGSMVIFGALTGYFWFQEEIFLGIYSLCSVAFMIGLVLCAMQNNNSAQLLGILFVFMNSLAKVLMCSFQRQYGPSELWATFYSNVLVAGGSFAFLFTVSSEGFPELTSSVTLYIGAVALTQVSYLYVLLKGSRLLEVHMSTVLTLFVIPNCYVAQYFLLDQNTNYYEYLGAMCIFVSVLAYTGVKAYYEERDPEREHLLPQSHARRECAPVV